MHSPHSPDSPHSFLFLLKQTDGSRTYCCNLNWSVCSSLWKQTEVKQPLCQLSPGCVVPKILDCWFGVGRSCSATLPPAAFVCTTPHSHNTRWGFWRSKAKKIEITKRGNIALKSMLLLFVFAHILLFTFILFNLYSSRKSWLDD